MGCVIPHQSNAVNISHQTNAGLRTIQVLPWRLCLDLPIGLFLSVFRARTLFAFLITPVRATCPASFSLLHLFIVIVFGEEYKSRSS